ncbi:acyltransferase family protein [Pararhizobium sp.]|uniref:acyltransferase family protein n=1 Tax=Pararhizobium sp. TaxID=1977563 RepID=UPI002719570E|nr:acyltransferase [Pararhizobium sp.]MDO9418708.1 acyltransferase [Pararhizobium sp.]
MAQVPKLLALESLRGFAAVTVVLYHFRYSSFLSENPFMQHGYLMVDFFFVLSGFVIALNYTNRLSSPADIVRFQRRRFWRLYPLHLFTLMIFLGIECLKYYFEQKTGIISNNPAFVASDSTAFVANLFLLQGLVFNELTFNGPSWSISVEFWTYLVFALAVGLLRLRTWSCLGLALLAAVILLALEGGALKTDPVFAIFRCLYAFFLGAWVATLGVRLSRHAAAPVASGVLLLVILIICLWGGTRAEIVLPPLFALAVVAVASLRDETGLRRFLEWPVFVWLGTISYSVYLTHVAVAWVVTQVLRFGLHVPTKVAEDGATIPALSQGLGTLVTLLAIVGVLVFSSLTYRFIEKPFRSGLPSRARSATQPQA